MCQFKSAIVVNTSEEANGFSLLHNPWTDSHEDLIRLHKLNDSATPRGSCRFARVEFRPEDSTDLADLSKYTLIIDEARTPDWFTEAKQAKVTDRLKVIVAAMIVTGEADLLCGGAYILAKDAKVSTVKNALIHVMMPGSKVGEMWGSSNVGVMWGSSNVGVMWGSSKVGEMWGSSNVGVMWESSNVGVMRESSNVGVMWGSSNVGVMRESSNVGVMWGSSNVGVMRESSNVGVMWGSSNVGDDKRTKPTQK